MHDSEISTSLKEPNAVTKCGFLIVLEVEVRPLEPHCLDGHKFLQGRRIAVNIYLGNAGPDNIFTAWICLRVVYRGWE
jgi:hypothetical protein